ncbi:MAG: two-component system response regulator, partial [Proteobacteria bacterium]
MAKKILLAEDSVTMQKVVQMTFEAEDFTVTAVSSAADALARAGEMGPDLVIADVSMGGKSGYDICAAIKADSGAPVLLLHGTAAPLDRARAQAVGADGDLEKPFETQALIDLAADLVARSVLQPTTALEVKPLSSPIESNDIVIDSAAFKPPAKSAVPAPKPATPLAVSAAPPKPAPSKPAPPKPAAAPPKPAPPKPPPPKPVAAPPK